MDLDPRLMGTVGTWVVSVLHRATRPAQGEAIDPLEGIGSEQVCRAAGSEE